MRIPLLCLLTLGLFMSPATAQIHGPEAAGSSHHAVGFEFDLVYGVGACLDTFGQPYLKELKLDVYYPLNHPSSSKPAMVLVHGALWGGGNDKREAHLMEAARYFAPRGMVCFSIDFRTTKENPDCFGINKWQRAQRASFVDAKAAVRWIRAHAADYGVDPGRITAYGGSSGGGSVICLAISEPDHYSTDWPGGAIHPLNHPGEDPGVQACHEFWGTCYELPGSDRCFDFSDEFNPGDAPIMITHGTDDVVIPFTHALDIESQCTTNGIHSRLYALPGGGHGNWNATYGTNPRKTLNELVWEFLTIDLGWVI